MPKLPRPETQYFGKIDLEKRRKIAEAKRDKLAKEEVAKLKRLHWRHCAECGMELEPFPFKGTTIHKCFNCGGVFLESGALEKLCGGERRIIESLLGIFKF